MMPQPNFTTDTAAPSAQPPMPPKNTIAWVFGQPVINVPQDLFTPPDTLKMVLGSFQGPLDLLLYLIRKQDIDVLNTPMMKITEQCLHYIVQMEAHQFDLAAEYLLVAAVPIGVKSHLLLPRPRETEEEETDPHAELVCRPLTYEQMKFVAQGLDALSRAGHDFAWAYLPLEAAVEAKLPEVYVTDLAQAWLGILSRARHTCSHEIVREAISMRMQMTSILQVLNEKGFSRFFVLSRPEQSVAYLVVNFVALLELAKGGLVRVVQPESYGEIEIHLENEKTEAATDETI